MKLIFPKYSFRGGVEEKPPETTLNLILMALTDKYPQGLDGGYKRTFSRIQTKLEEAIEKDAKFIEIQQDEIDLLKNLKDAKTKPVFVSNVVKLEDAIDNCRLVEVEKSKKVEKTN